VRTLHSALRALAVAGASAALVLVPGAAASAHDDLVSSNPAADSSITDDPGNLTLEFSDALLTLGDTDDGFAVQVTDPEGMHHESGCLALDGSQVTTDIALGDGGAYVVQWQVVSSDGHPTSGQYEFDYEPQSPDNAADGLASAPVCGDPWAGAPDEQAPVASSTGSPTQTTTDDPVAPSGATATDTAGPVTDVADDTGAGLPWPLVVVAALVGVGVIAAIIVLVVRRQRGGGYGQP
jgi:methionine-rich copper-binding protein CopC